MRVFFAIELPEDVKTHLQGMRARFERGRHGRVKWERPENLHLTLKFLGDVSDAAVVGLCDAVKRVRVSGPIRLRPQGWVLFPERGPVRIIGAGVGGDLGQLTLLYQGIESVCEATGYPREARAYHAHLTIGRAKDGLPARVRGIRGQRSGGQVAEPSEEVGPPFDVGEFVLMESQLRPQGSLYTTVARFPLNAADVKQ